MARIRIEKFLSESIIFQTCSCFICLQKIIGPCSSQPFCWFHHCWWLASLGKNFANLAFVYFSFSSALKWTQFTKITPHNKDMICVRRYDFKKSWTSTSQLQKWSQKCSMPLQLFGSMVNKAFFIYIFY